MTMREQIQQIVKRIQEAADHIIGFDNLMHETLHSIADDLEAAIAPQWVPVAERLPDSSREVWVFADGDIFRAIHNHWAWVDVMNCEIEQSPTHWHEIDYPEPPPGNNTGLPQ